MARGALISEDRLGLINAELIEQVKENPQLQSYIGTPEKGKSIPAQLVSGMMSR